MYLITKLNLNTVIQTLGGREYTRFKSEFQGRRYVRSAGHKFLNEYGYKVPDLYHFMPFPNDFIVVSDSNMVLLKLAMDSVSETKTYKQYDNTELKRIAELVISLDEANKEREKLVAALKECES